MVLAGAIMAALAGTIIDNKVKGTHKERSHNNLFLINECLAEHQSAYLIFAIGLVTGTVLFKYDWTRAAISIYIIVTLVFYIIGVSITADQTERLKDFHACSGNKCTVKLPLRKRFRIIWVNLVLTALLLSFSVYLCAITVKAPG
jgi:hypothetical protein